MKKILILNKKEGETPLEALNVFRNKNKEYKDVKMTYAGRLDPLASGLLLVLTGDAVKEKEKYLKLSKEYTFQILFGFSTDTYDILGKIVKNTEVKPMYLDKNIKTNLKHFRGQFIQKYPIYSSKTVRGKQLFEYAREGIDVEVPSREVDVQSLKFLKVKKISASELLNNIHKRILKVKGDFRQEEILQIWKKALKNDRKTQSIFFVGNFKIKCSSGTYVRGIANSLGEAMSISALAFSIKRTKIGRWIK